MNLRRFKEHADEIRFVEKNSDHLSMCWSHPLKNAHGRAVNPSTNTMWYDMVEGIYIKHPEVDEDCIWATNETGFQPASGERERVIGAMLWSPFVLMAP